MPVSGFIISLLGIYHWQVAFPACAAAALAIYVLSLLKRKLLEAWIVTDYAGTQFIYALLSGPALLLAVKNHGEFLTVKTFCNSPAEYFAVAISVSGLLPASCHSQQLPALLSLFFNTHKAPSWIFAYSFSPDFPCCLPRGLLLVLATYSCGSSFEGLSQLTRNLLARKQIKMVAKDHPGYKVLYVLDTSVFRSQWQNLLCGERSHWVWVEIIWWKLIQLLMGFLKET